MRKEDMAIIGLWLLILVAGGLVIKYIVWPLLSQAIEIIVAIISGLVVIIGGILTHAFTEIRNQHIAQTKEKQKNYEQLISHIGQLIKNPEAIGDAFAKVHLQSWIVGSPDVILKTKTLMKADNAEKKNKALTDLLFAMRKDLGLNASTKIGTVDGLFKGEGHL